MIYKVLPIIACLVFFSCTAKYKAPANSICDRSSQTDSSDIEKKLGLSASQMNLKTGVYSLENGGKSLIIRAWLCDQAKKSLDIQYYIFSKDNTGLIACDFLVRAADRGVRIRLIIDDVTVKAGSEEIYALDSHENIEIKVFNPGVKFGRPGTRIKKIFTEFNKLHRRMHIKTITVDHKISITGGRNIADEYFDYHKEYNFRDRDVLLIGKGVKQIETSFEEYWNDPLSVPYKDLVRKNKHQRKSKDPDRFNRLHAYACDPENFSQKMREKIKNFPNDFKELQEAGEIIWLDDLSYVADEPGKNLKRKEKKGSETADSLIALIKQAKYSVDIQSPYLITTETGKNLFRELVGRGVKVRVLTNSLASTDNHEAFNGYQRDRKEILATGIEIYEWNPHPQVRYKIMTPEVQAAMNYTPVVGMHSKTMVIDGHITVIGSFNLDPRSVNLNSECIVIMRSKEVSNILMKYVNEEFLPENSWRITPEFNPDSVAKGRKRIKSATRSVIPKNIL